MNHYERFSQYLNMLIEQAGLHKNKMVRLLEIDRSSYFQILKGRRLPTKKQYRKLKELLFLPKEEKERLDDLYCRASFGEKTWEDILRVRTLIQVLCDNELKNQTDASGRKKADEYSTQSDMDYPSDTRFLQGESAVRAGITEIFKRSGSTGTLDYFMPASANAFYELLNAHLAGAGHELHVRELSGLPGGRAADINEAQGVFNGLRTYLSLSSDISLECRYYYNSVSKISDIGLLYPWFIICGNCVLMLSADLLGAVITYDAEIVKAFSAQFEKAFSESTPLMRNYGSLEQNLGAIREFLKGRCEVNYEAIPCIAMIATPDMIRKYVIPQAQGELIAHCSTLQRDETMIDVSSISGLKRFLRERRIPEIPSEFMSRIETEDLIWYVDILLERLGETLFIIDESRISAAYDWDITIIEEYSVLIHHHNFDTIILDEKNLVDMFTSFAQNITETPFVMDTEKARKELLEIRSELVNES